MTTGAEFETQFIARCTAMRITARLAANRYAPAMIWLTDDAYHAQHVMYCGCDDVTVWRNGHELFSQCAAHHVQPLGLARRIRRNFVYAGARS